jgi:hypothetical protein
VNHCAERSSHAVSGTPFGGADTFCGTPMRTQSVVNRTGSPNPWLGVRTGASRAGHLRQRVALTLVGAALCAMAGCAPSAQAAIDTPRTLPPITDPCPVSHANSNTSLRELREATKSDQTTSTRSTTKPISTFGGHPTMSEAEFSEYVHFHRQGIGDWLSDRDHLTVPK